MSNQVAFLAAKKGELLELVKEGEEAFDASGSSIVTLLLKSANDTVRETAPKRAKEDDGEDEEAPPAKAKSVETPTVEVAMMNPLSGHPMQLGSLKYPLKLCKDGCQGYGHDKAECPPKAGNGFCKRCGGKGHFFKECTSAWK